MGKVSHFLGSEEGPCAITKTIHITMLCLVPGKLCILYDSEDTLSLFL